jgi:hypothetical protein
MGLGVLKKEVLFTVEEQPEAREPGGRIGEPSHGG